MGVAILTITKSAAGEEWSNTWGISNGPDDGPADAADIEAIVSTNPAGGLNAATTDPTGGSYGGATSIIAAILGFERLMHFPQVHFTQLNLSDASTPGTPTGPFWSQAVSFDGLSGAASPIAEANIAPLNVALLVNRNVNVIGVRPGRLYFRAVLADQSVKIGSRVGVTWTDASQQVAVAALVADAIDDSSISEYFSSPSGPLPGIFLSVPHYSTVDGAEGQIIGGAAVSGLSANKPVSRQLTRGRRRRVAP